MTANNQNPNRSVIYHVPKETTAIKGKSTLRLYVLEEAKRLNYPISTRLGDDVKANGGKE